MLGTAAPSISRYSGATPSHSRSPVPASSSITSSSDVFRFNARKLEILRSVLIVHRLHPTENRISFQQLCLPRGQKLSIPPGKASTILLGPHNIFLKKTSTAAPNP